ncbi:MAG: GMP synthase (glutamine-hydrolyzing) [Candidatus Thorarchaeota archaeon]
MFFDPDQVEQKQALYEPALWVRPQTPLSYDILWKIRDQAEKDGYPRVVLQLSEGSGSHPIILKAFESSDVMEAMSMELPMDMLQKTAQGVSHAVNASRIGYEISKKPPASVELF